MLAYVLYNRLQLPAGTPKAKMNSEAQQEHPPDQKNRRQDTSYLIRKKGFITGKRKDMVTVNVENEIVNFSLDNVVCDYSPRIFDRITLFCDPQDEESLTSEDGATLEVRKIECQYTKNHIGRITYVDPDEWGIIDEKYFFFWDALARDYNVVNHDDRVVADCIECESDDDNTYRWRCLDVKLLFRTQNLPNNMKRLSVDGITANKHGIEVDDNIFVEFNDLEDVKTIVMMVKNTSNADVECLESLFEGEKLNSQLELISPRRKESFLLKAGAEKKYLFKATSKMYGEAQEKFVIKFRGTSDRNFKILRLIRVIVHDTDGLHGTIGTGINVQRNYSYTHSVLTTNQSDIIQGVPPNVTPNFVSVKFDVWQIPKKLADIALKSSRTVIFEELGLCYPHLQIDNKSLSSSNNSKVFHDLLYLEECEMNHNIRKYDKRAHFTRENEYLAVEIQDVAETRPSLVIGDYVLAAYLKPEVGKIPWKGYIYEVKQNRILLKFSEGFHTNYKNENYQLTFHFSRNSLRKQHHAIESATERLPLILFPDDVIDIEKQVDVSLNLDNGELQSGTSVLPWFNPSLNIMQKQAVTNILQGVARPTPYVIFGPPGTGKTVTLIEVVLQLIRNVRNSRILVATPSNSAANLLTERIIDSQILKQDEFVRLLSHNNLQRGSVPQKVLNYCGTIDIARDGTTKGTKAEFGVSMFNAKKLMSRRLLIGTCITLGSLMQCEFPEDHFTHVIVDESGQCLETELIIPMQFVDKHIGQVILAGDPLQLGPVVLSHFAGKLGLKKSFLERLLERKLYQPDLERFQHHYDPRVLTKLIQNYRSLPRLMHVYNELFYNNELKALLNEVDSEEAKILRKLSPILPHHGFRNVPEAVFVIGVKGRNERCSESPSWYNKEEAKSVSLFFSKLIKLGFDADDIGIITPYTQQVKSIRAIILKNNIRTDIAMPKIGTVEEFQGQERKIILLSTVRTMQRELCKDTRYSLGFIKSPKRMNVAISRARAALVIFGSPKLLSIDKNWKYLIERCNVNKCSVNCVDGNFLDDDSDE